MNNENEKKLFVDFPNLYAGRNLPITENLMPFGFECGDGWFNLIYELSEKITKLDPNCKAVQVKEKFGGLRFYTGGTTKEVHDLISEYENKSYKTCEDCGDTETAKTRDDGWIYTLCNKCWKELKKRKRERYKEFQKSLKDKEDGNKKSNSCDA